MKKYHEPLQAATLKLPVRVLQEIQCLAGKRKTSEFIRTAIDNHLVSLTSQNLDKEAAGTPICKEDLILAHRD